MLQGVALARRSATRAAASISSCAPRRFSPALAEARLQALQARIRPHFLFNSLNAVLSLIRSEPRRAEATLEDLADLFRVLMRDTRDMTTLDEEIQLCRQYLSIEKDSPRRTAAGGVGADQHERRRVAAGANSGRCCCSRCWKTRCTTASSRPPKPVLVQVHLGRWATGIEISVINPYHAATGASDGNHMALNNIRERLSLLYDVEAQLVTTIARGFFEVRLRFPYVKEAG